MIGTTVSRYRIVSKLGGAGMGVVYEAEDLELQRRVAVKFLPEERTKTPAALERFKREARAASALNHPHICTVYDVGSHEGQPFLVMERLAGQTLRHAIEEGPLPADRVLALGEQIADALDAAHRAGIVHRDVKPANLFVTERGEAKVLDFGLAKVDGATQGERVSTEAPTEAKDLLTADGATVGTVAYMSPEQARGVGIDARSDLFSLGVVLYEMLTGRLPFEGESQAELFASILRSDPAPPSRFSRAVPAGLERVVLKALEKDKTLRYQTAADLRGDLLRVRRGSGDPAGGRRHRVRRDARPRADRDGGRSRPLDRGAALRQHELRPRAGVLLRRHLGGAAEPTGQDPRAARGRPHLVVLVQGPEARDPGDRPAAEGDPRPRRLGPQVRQHRARQRAAREGGRRLPPVVGDLRSHDERHLPQPTPKPLALSVIPPCPLPSKVGSSYTCTRERPRLGVEVNAAVDRAIAERPELLDFKDMNPGPRILNVDAFMVAVVAALGEAGLCAHVDAEGEVAVKTDNSFNEQWIVVSPMGWSTPTEHWVMRKFAAGCEPSAF